MAGNSAKRMKYRYFFLSFAVSFLILSVMFLFLMSMVHPDSPGIYENEPENEEAAVYAPTRDEALSILFVGVDAGGSEADTFILARFDPAREQIPVTVFPRQTLLIKGGKSETLADAYRYGGAEYTRDQLARELGIGIDRFVRMDVASFIVAADAVGSVYFELAQDLAIGRSGGTSMTLSKGMQLLDGRKAAELIHYGEYGGGELTRCAVTADLTAAIINQRIDIANSTIVDKLFEKVINLVDTDITHADYDTRKEAAKYLAQLERSPAFPVTGSGVFNDDSTTYTLSDTYTARLTQIF